MENEAILRELIATACVDCYGVEEEFWGMLVTLEEMLEFPLAATLIGEKVDLVGIDSAASSENRGIVARIAYKGKAYSVSLSDLQLCDTSSDSEAWLAAYRLWLQW